MEPEKRREMWGVIQAIGSIYCCVIGTWVLLYPPGSETSQTQGAVPMSPHLVWWQIIMIVGFAICALALAVGAFVAFFPRISKKKIEPKLVIHSAFYGTEPENDKDVTAILQNHTKDALAFDVNNISFGVDPAPMRPKRLEVEYSYGNKSVRKISRSEGSRLVLPEDQEVQRLASQLKQIKTNQATQQSGAYPIPQLRLKVLSLCSELQGFLGQHGQEPKVERQLPESADTFTQRWRTTVMPWRAKFIGDYRLKFGDSVPRLRDEIRVWAGIDDFALNASIEKAEKDPNGNMQAVEGIVNRFWDLALEINA